MAYDDYLADRIRRPLKKKRTTFSKLKMMSGISRSLYLQALEKPECRPMDFTGRPMKGYIFVTPVGFDHKKDLSYWLNLCLDFNPLTKACKKKN